MMQIEGKKYDYHENNSLMQPFKELLAIIHEEELIRFRRRSEKAGNRCLARLLEVEINKRGR